MGQVESKRKSKRTSSSTSSTSGSAASVNPGHSASNSISINNNSSSASTSVNNKSGSASGSASGQSGSANPGHSPSNSNSGNNPSTASASVSKNSDSGSASGSANPRPSSGTSNNSSTASPSVNKNSSSASALTSGSANPGHSPGKFNFANSSKASVSRSTSSTSASNKSDSISTSGQSGSAHSSAGTSNKSTASRSTSVNNKSDTGSTSGSANLQPSAGKFNFTNSSKATALASISTSVSNKSDTGTTGSSNPGPSAAGNSSTPSTASKDKTRDISTIISNSSPAAPAPPSAIDLSACTKDQDQEFQAQPVTVPQESVSDMAPSAKEQGENGSNETKSGKAEKEKRPELRSRSRSPSPDLPEGVFEVEQILDYDKDCDLYFIKWKNYDKDDDNTWEPADNLGCPEILWNFYLSRKREYQVSNEAEFLEPGAKRRKLNKSFVPPDPRPLDEKIDSFLLSYKGLSDDEILEAYRFALANSNPTISQKWPEDKVKRMLDDFSLDKLDHSQKEDLRKQVRFNLAHRRMNHTYKELKEWQKEINEITQGRPEVTVENFEDFCGRPADFKYSNDYVCGEGIEVPDDPPLGCECADNCTVNKRKCCPMGQGHKGVYYSNRKVRVPPGVPIFECNKKCLCDEQCPNRVVQDGVTPLEGLQMTIFRTDNGRGWGVKTKKKIAKGTFVCIYVGEIINAAEALKRGKEYDQVGSTYLFDLDINEGDDNTPGEDCVYTVDALKVGNISHFINHSCDPNLSVYNIWVDCLDPNLPKLALFALKDIPRGTELTFDYKSQPDDSDKDKSSSTNDDSINQDVPPIKKMECMCGSENCRKFLF